MSHACKQRPRFGRLTTRLIAGVLAALPLFTVSLAPADALAQETRQRWKLASAFPATFPLVGTAGKRVAELITRNTGGSIEVRFYDPGALVPALEIFDAVSKGTVDAGWHVGVYIAAKVPAAQIFAGIPFGPHAQEYLAWFDHGGGQQLYDKVYNARNVKGFICTTLAPEAGGWFRKEIASVDDFKGLKFRIAGLGGKAIEKLGASAVLTAPGDVMGALERGVIDGTEYSSPAIDVSAEYYKVAKHYHFPGWHQPVAVWELLLNLAKWNALSPTQQAQIESSCRDNIVASIADGEAAQTEALEKILSNGVQIHRFPEPVLAALRDASSQAITEAAAGNAEFKEVWDSLSAFRAKYESWRVLRQ